MDNFMSLNNLDDINEINGHTKEVPHSNNDVHLRDDLITQTLSTKAAIKFLLEGKLKAKVCRYCLNITQGLCELDQVMNIAGSGGLYKVTIRQIIASFHPFKVAEDLNFPNKICQKCIDKALAAYLFTQQCERSERALLNCFEDIYEKFIKLDPIDHPKKRGRQKLNPNYNKLIAEFAKVIDYAEPIINIINVEVVPTTKEPGINDLECKKCWQVLPNLKSLSNHEKIHPKTMWYHCRLCGKSFPKFNQLKKHNHNVHTLGKEIKPQKENSFKCKNCDHVTENYICHLQHIEMHKFKKVMGHLLEKKMDSLCVVCYNKADNMMDLDTRVCIHGAHPDLTGDKSVYSILASTLPNPKYQELYIPTKAKIVTLGKRKCNNDYHNAKKIKSNTFIFSYPLIISEYKNTKNTIHKIIPDAAVEKWKINDFLTSNEENCNNHNKTINVMLGTDRIPTCLPVITSIENTTDSYIIQQHTKDITNVNLNFVHNVFPSHRFTEIENLKTNNTKKATLKIGDHEFWLKNDFTHKTLSFDNAIYEPLKAKRYDLNYNSKYDFSSGELMDANNKFDTVESSLKACNFETPEIQIKTIDGVKEYNINAKNIANCEGSHLKVTETCVVNTNNKMCTKNVIDNVWQFKNTGTAIFTTHGEGSRESLLGKMLFKSGVHCKNCWIFKNTAKCDHCKKLNEKFKTTQHSIVKVNSPNEQETWQCNICLTKNSLKRLACICCENLTITNSTDARIPFNNENVFFQKQDSQKETPQKISKCVNFKETPIENKVIEKRVVIDNQNILEENVGVLAMDVEIYDTVVKDTNCCDEVKYYCDNMEVEECQVLSNEGLNWNILEVSHINSNITDTDIPHSSNLGTNLHFNIGLSNNDKYMSHRKHKKLRRMNNISQHSY